MRKKIEWSHITYEVGRYLPGYGDDPKTFKPYTPVKDRLYWLVFNEENGEIVPINLFEYNWVFLLDLVEAKKKYGKDFTKFAEEVRASLQHEYWSRSEYETIITSWPPYIEAEELDRLNKERDERLAKGWNFYRESVNLTCGYKIDIYDQVMLNWDRFIEYVWNNKRLITIKKLGLESVATRRKRAKK